MKIEMGICESLKYPESQHFEVLLTPEGECSMGTTQDDPAEMCRFNEWLFM